MLRQQTIRLAETLEDVAWMELCAKDVEEKDCSANSKFTQLHTLKRSVKYNMLVFVVLLEIVFFSCLHLGYERREALTFSEGA